MRLALRNGTVYDGTGAEGRVADVLVDDGRIAAVGRFDGEAEAIDATGLAVAPGFVDIHSHSDYTLLVDPRAVSAIHQGVTTEVVGNCGFGCFPIRDPALAQRAIYGFDGDVPLTWSTAGEYFERLEAARPAVNVLSLVPNGQLRLATVGLADRPATSAERADMQALLRESLDAGAWGYSTGLEYAQEQGVTEEECAQLARLRAVLRDAHAPPRRRAPPTPSPRRSASAAKPGRGCRSRTSCRATGSTRAAAASSSSRRRATPDRTSLSTCTRGRSG